MDAVKLNEWRVMRAVDNGEQSKLTSIAVKV
jgi:hypothetical protein